MNHPKGYSTDFCLECTNGNDVVKVTDIALTMNEDICMKSLIPNKRLGKDI